MKSSKIRTIVATAVFVVLSIGLVANACFGTLSGFGWDDIVALCPLGAITAMIASHTLIPRALVSLAVMAVIVLVVGRAFCGWVCPVPLLQRIRGFFRSPNKRRELREAKRREVLSVRESGAGCGACSSCGKAHEKIDSRHLVLGGTLLSTALFGFPVFCLACPIGLTFATVLLWWRLFADGDMTWSVVLVPALLVVEVLFLRRWCSRICPLSGLMNLVSRFSKTFRPTIDDAKCLETSKGTACGRCAMACEAGINLRHLDQGERSLADCTRCRACVDACPAQAVSLPFLPKTAPHSSCCTADAPAASALDELALASPEDETDRSARRGMEG